MVHTCAAIGCQNSSTKPECRAKGVSFHGFPLKNKQLLMQWLLEINRGNDLVPSPHSKICSDHFKEEYFEYQPFTGRRQLKNIAVPTKFIYHENEGEGQHEAGAPPRERKLRRTRRTFESSSFTSGNVHSSESDLSTDVLQEKKLKLDGLTDAPIQHTTSQTTNCTEFMLSNK